MARGVESVSAGRGEILTPGSSATEAREKKKASSDSRRSGKTSRVHGWPAESNLSANKDRRHSRILISSRGEILMPGSSATEAREKPGEFRFTPVSLGDRGALGGQKPKLPVSLGD